MNADPNLSALGDEDLAMVPNGSALLERFSRAEISAVELRRAMGGVTYGDLVHKLAQHGLPLPRASQAGREDRVAMARALLFGREA